jgi:uncharacterized protein
VIRNAYACWLLAGSLAACGVAPDDEQRVLQDATQHAILPLHAAFVQASGALHETSVDFCAVPDEAAYRETQAAWQKAMVAWQQLQVVRFGPVNVDNQAWRIQFWPDRNNLVGQKIESLLASDTALSAEQLEADSVVIQGLTAAEYLLFDAGHGALANYQSGTEGAHRRCTLLRLIAGHTAGVANGLAGAWSPTGGDHAAVFTAPGPDNPDYADKASALSVLLDSVLAAVEIAKNDKLADPLGLSNSAGIPQPYAAEAWRSRYSLPLVIATVAGARQLYFAGEPGDASFGIDDLLRTKDAGALADDIASQFARVQASTPTDLVLFDAVNDPEQAEQLLAYHAALTVLAQLIKNEVPPVLGVTLGFNDKDGD